MEKSKFGFKTKQSKIGIKNMASMKLLLLCKFQHWKVFCANNFNSGQFC